MSRRSMPRRTFETFLQHRHHNHQVRLLQVRNTLQRQAERNLRRNTKTQAVSRNGASQTSARNPSKSSTSSSNRSPITRHEYEVAMAEIRSHVTEWWSQSGSGATAGAPSNITQAKAEILNQSLIIAEYVKGMGLLKTKVQFNAAVNACLRHIAPICSRDREYAVTVIQDGDLPIGAVVGPPLQDYLTSPNPKITRYHSPEFTKNLQLFISMLAPKEPGIEAALDKVSGGCREPMLVP